MGFAAGAQSLSIYDIQFTTDPDGASPCNGQIVDCRGGIIVKIFDRTVPRLLVQDPNHPQGWGAIQVKDRYNITSGFSGLLIGDRIELKNVEVEDYRGTTFLQLYTWHSPQITVLSRDHPLPEPLLIEPNQIAAPRQDAYGNFFVADHAAEKYESMLIRIENVNVTQMDLGKALDNYQLQRPGEPDMICWAADYINADKSYYDDYCPPVEIGKKFCVLEGMLEQYTNLSDGFDYYQLLTTAIDDFYLPNRADFDQSCCVDLVDYAFLLQHWLNLNCQNPNWCDHTDLSRNHAVGLEDLFIFTQNWLRLYEKP